jgi:hypothetical protein
MAPDVLSLESLPRHFRVFQPLNSFVLSYLFYLRYSIGADHAP